MYDYSKEQYLRSPVRPIIWQHLNSYGIEAAPVGDFLLACLCNDWRDAIRRADADNLAGMHEIMIYLANELPGNCHGSPLIVARWFLKHDRRLPDSLFRRLVRMKAEARDLLDSGVLC